MVTLKREFITVLWYTVHENKQTIPGENEKYIWHIIFELLFFEYGYFSHCTTHTLNFTNVSRTLMLRELCLRFVM